jgi:hypothetical protein
MGDMEMVMTPDKNHPSDHSAFPAVEMDRRIYFVRLVG